MKNIVAALLLMFSLALTRLCAVEVNSLFSDNAVLQQNKALPIWGTGRDGEKISVKLGDRLATTTVSGGKWSVKLAALSACGPLTLTVTGDNILTVSNLLVGEVWVCSGQSNMERQLGPRPPQKPLENWEQEAASADSPQIRMFFVHRDESQTPLTDARGKWVVCSPQTAKDFSAVGFFFARALQANLKVPIGMIFTSVGGTAVELWTSPEAVGSVLTGAELLRKSDQDIREFPEKLAKFKAEESEQLSKYTKDLAAAATAGKPEPNKPSAPRDPSAKRPGCLFNGMVAPLIPYAIRGVIWYQGESNGGQGKEYRTLFPLMIHDWRDRWQQGEFPFCFVQLATYRACDPMIREAQLLTLSRVPQTAMVVTTDVGDANDIHPARKKPVGERLALAARALAYGEKIESSGPLFESSEFKDGKVIVHFSHGRGLTSKGGALTGFVIAGADKKFTPADAVIVDDAVVVRSPTVLVPMAVRYNWAGVAEGNLYNAADLPASPFRTDMESDDAELRFNSAVTPATYCNPLPLPDYPIGRAARDITNGEAWDSSGGWLLEHKEQFRELADPTAIWEGGKWYLYPSVDMAWVSEDKGATWQHHPLNVSDIGYAPTVVKHKGKFLMLASGSGLYAADSPLGEFKEMGRIELPAGVPSQVDPMLFSDDDGRLFYYWGCSRAGGIWAVELDPDQPTKMLGVPREVVPFDPVKQPWEAVGEWNQNPNVGWVEGSWMLKRNGKYYLTFSAAGTENRTYAMGCYTASSPLGPFTAQKRNPIFRTPSGLVTGTAHGCIVAGPKDELWVFHTIRGGVANAFERRIGMDRAQLDTSGELFVPAATSVPQWVSDSGSVDHLPTPDWLPLNTGMPTLGSTCASNLPGRFAVDDEMRTWWQPALDDLQPTLTSRFVGAAEVQAVRIIWRDVGLDTHRGVIAGPFRYRVEISSGEGEWKTLIDRSASTEDFLIDYRECPPATGVAARLIIIGHPKGITPAVAEFTVFGKVNVNPSSSKPRNPK